MSAHHTPPAVGRPHVPTLWADGRHDDAPALQAYFDGAVVHVGPKAQAFVREKGSLTGGVYLLKGNLCISSSYYTIRNVEFINAGHAFLTFSGNNGTMDHNIMRGFGLSVGDECPSPSVK